MRSALGKVAWVGRTASMVFGLALVLALVVGLASTALAHTNIDTKLFHLGHNNPVGRLSALTGTLTGALLKLDNNGTGPALQLEVAQNGVPLKVNAAAGTATNLSADELDGQDASAFASADSAPLWAVVDENGNIVQSKGAVSSLRISPGFYKVVFNRDVDQCAYSAMPVSPDRTLFGFGVTVTNMSESTEYASPDTLYVFPYDDGDTQTNQRFHLIVYC